MNTKKLKLVDQVISIHEIKRDTDDHDFYLRLVSNFGLLNNLYDQIYAHHPSADICFEKLIGTIVLAYKKRNTDLKNTDEEKAEKDNWYLSNELAGMSLYVDRFCGSLKNLPDKLDYLEDLGINLIHIMPVFESPESASDGGYAVSDFRKVNRKFGNLQDLQVLQKKMMEKKFHLMIDIVLNHTSNQHEWAQKAANGDKEFQDFYYMYDSRDMPDKFDESMPEIFPENAPGNFTFIESCNKWVMSVFHNYQWDLNYTNPAVFVYMLDNIFFYANLGVDILRIDAPAFIWKQPGTTSQNLPQAHTLLQLIKCCVSIAAPGMAILGEAIVAPEEILKYFGSNGAEAMECDFAYNATQMALQWDALATGDTRIMLAGQEVILQKPFGTSWITYTRCHDDIGLGYTDHMISSAGFQPYYHRQFIKDYYSGIFPASPAKGTLFSYNPKTGDARISGTLASLAGLETALQNNDGEAIDISINKILLMQAMSIMIGGVPMIFYGDEAGYTNDYSYLDDPGKAYDNRWMHRPAIDWRKNQKVYEKGTIENRIFSGTQKLITIRKKQKLISDRNNIRWLSPHNIHVAGFSRTAETEKMYCIFNFRSHTSFLTWYALKEQGLENTPLTDLWTGDTLHPGADNEFLILKPYRFYLLVAGPFAE